MPWIPLGVVLVLTNCGHLDAEALADWIISAGAAGPLVLMAIYAPATVPFLPGTVDLEHRSGMHPRSSSPTNHRATSWWKNCWF